jgi:hypothetical protein
MIRLEGEQDTRQSRIEYVREHFPELVKAFEAEYDQVIGPQLLGLLVIFFRWWVW